MFTTPMFMLVLVLVEGPAPPLSQSSIVPAISPMLESGWLPPGPPLSTPQQLWLTQRAAAERDRAPRATVTMICGMPVIKADPEFDKKIVAKAPPHLDEKMARETPCPK